MRETSCAVKDASHELVDYSLWRSGLDKTMIFKSDGPTYTVRQLTRLSLWTDTQEWSRVEHERSPKEESWAAPRESSPPIRFCGLNLGRLRRLRRLRHADTTDILCPRRAGPTPGVGARNRGHESDERQAKHHCEKFLDHATHLLSRDVSGAISVPVRESPQKKRVWSET